MTVKRLFAPGNNGLSFINDGSSYTLGMSFETKSDNLQALGASMWLAPEANASNLANLGLRASLWLVHLNSYAIDPYLVVSQLVAPSGSDLGTWYDIFFDSPYDISNNECYVIAVTMPPQIYSAIGGYFQTGSSAVPPSGVTDVAPIQNYVQPWRARNGTFNAGSRAVLRPNDDYNATWYGIDFLYQNNTPTDNPPTPGITLFDGTSELPVRLSVFDGTNEKPISAHQVGG